MPAYPKVSRRSHPLVVAEARPSRPDITASSGWRFVREISQMPACAKFHQSEMAN
jgi:hypothetical protein